MRTKIDFGIDLGTTNSAIAKMENGKPMIVTTGRADIIPSCVAIQNGGRILVGDRGKTIFTQEKEKELTHTWSLNGKCQIHLLTKALI